MRSDVSAPLVLTFSTTVATSIRSPFGSQMNRPDSSVGWTFSTIAAGAYSICSSTSFVSEAAKTGLTAVAPALNASA